MVNKKDIFSIAIGTFGLGADRFETWNEEQNISDEYQLNDLNSLIHSFNKGQNYIETSFIYAGGLTMKFLKQFFIEVPRDKIFVTVKIENYIEKIEDIEQQLDKYLEIMGLGFADSILLHTPASTKLPLEIAYKELQRLATLGKSRYVSASNLSLEQLKFLVEDNEIELFSFEGLYNLECKFNEDNGIIDYCKKNNIIFVNYQPFRRNRTVKRNYPLLIELASKYNKTQNQILLNWMIKEKGLYPITKTSKSKYIDSNISALNFEISKGDMNKLNEFRSKEFDGVEVDWENKGGVPIWKVANQFE